MFKTYETAIRSLKQKGFAINDRVTPSFWSHEDGRKASVHYEGDKHYVRVFGC